MKLELAHVLFLITPLLTTELDRSLFEEGRRQFEVLQVKSQMPRYGQCWVNALTLIQSGCKRLTDDTQARLALAYLNCFLQLHGRDKYSCREEQPLESCTSNMSDSDRGSLTTFFTHTQSICYFLQAQNWQHKTEETISDLAHQSSQVADSLKAAHELQQEMLISQNASLLNQKQLLLFIQEQKGVIGEVFQQLTILHSTMSGLFSFYYYALSILVSYLLTSTNRTAGARFWLFLLMTINVALELTLVTWLSSYLSTSPETKQERLIWLQWQCRRVVGLVGGLVLFLSAYYYKDMNWANNALLVEIRRQNSSIQQILSSSSQEEKPTSVPKEAVSSDSDYTSDSSEDDSELDTSYLPLHSHNGSDLPLESDTNSEVSADTVRDKHHLKEELDFLRESTPMRDLKIENWLRSTVSDSPIDNRPKPTNLSPQNSSSTSPYNLRPRLSITTSPKVLEVESSKSFSKTVMRMQAISEKNSRLARALIQDNTTPSSLNESKETSSYIQSSILDKSLPETRTSGLSRSVTPRSRLSLARTSKDEDNLSHSSTMSRRSSRLSTKYHR